MTTSERVSRSSSATGSTPSSRAWPGSRFALQPSTCIPNARPYPATMLPSRPRPSTPRVRPDSSGPIVVCQPPARTAASSCATRRVTASTSAQVSSAGAACRLRVPQTSTPRSRAASRSIAAFTIPVVTQQPQVRQPVEQGPVERGALPHRDHDVAAGQRGRPARRRAGGSCSATTSASSRSPTAPRRARHPGSRPAPSSSRSEFRAPGGRGGFSAFHLASSPPSSAWTNTKKSRIRAIRLAGRGVRAERRDPVVGGRDDLAHEAVLERGRLVPGIGRQPVAVAPGAGRRHPLQQADVDQVADRAGDRGRAHLRAGSASSAAVSASSSAAMSVTSTREGIRGKPQSVKTSASCSTNGPHLLRRRVRSRGQYFISYTIFTTL